MSTIRNALDLEGIQRVAGRHSDLPSKPFVLVIGRLHRDKAVEIIVRAIAKLPDPSKIEVWIMGEGTERAGIEPEIKLASLCDDVNPCALSKSNGCYVLTKQVFESPSRFTAFVSALGQGKDYVDAILFDGKGRGDTERPEDRPPPPGLQVKKKLGYVRDAAGNAYRLDNNDWKAVRVSQINIKML